MAKKKATALPVSISTKCELIDPEHETLAISKQCKLLNLNRSTYYARQIDVPSEAILEKASLDAELSTHMLQLSGLRPSMGSRSMTMELNKLGYCINRKRIRRLMTELNIISQAPGPYTSTPRKENPVYPYLLKDAKINAVDEVWSTDITYVKVGASFMYVSAIIDWYSRYIISWEVSNTLDLHAPLSCLQKALDTGRKPLIFNTDQGCQFTSYEFTSKLHQYGIHISMDSKGRAIDNIFIERFWRSLKYEWLHFWDFENGHQLHHSIAEYIDLYNRRRCHQSLNASVPAEIYEQGLNAPELHIRRKHRKDLTKLKSITHICSALDAPSENRPITINCEEIMKA